MESYQKLRFNVLTSLVVGAFLSLASVSNAGAQTSLQALQISAVDAVPTSGPQIVLEGEVIFDPNMLTLTYCLAAPFNVQSQCVSTNLTSTLTGSDSGSGTGRQYVGRIDQGSKGSLPVINGQAGQTIPILNPTFQITRIATSNESFDGYFTILLSVSMNSNGQYLPVIGPIL